MLQGKKGLVVGVANKNSIAWSIAEALHEHGAQMAFSYAGERLEKSVRKLAESIGSSVVLPCDVGDDDQVKSLFDSLKDQDFVPLDFIIHSVAFARREDLQGNFVNTPREGFHLATDISAYSLHALTAAACPHLSDSASIVTMSYLGAERVIPNYNIMGVAKAALESTVKYLAADLGEKGIRVNAISAGPVNTLAARGISGFKEMLEQVAARAPLKRNIEPKEIGNTALFLVSDLSSGITGEVIHVDAGYSITAM